ncbi:hypothetical protein AGOR_G00197200 [Albula goreensis]|uniref:Uncharacterized protein n=1 Tax=Albula goreensis TaxID=1534307 RepID=A0A8T3CN87_9TELE|nr:hypothetical protein AGOR_G00197200 [Albula goreensis]
MVEAERRGIQIVTSPYTINFQKTATYFKPGMPFDVVVYVTNPDDTPAKGIDVKVTPGTGRGKTQEDGTARLTVNTKDDGSDTLQITVKTEDSKLTPEQQAVAEMTALPYKTKGGSKNYLHISIQATELKIKGNLRISLNLVSPGSQNSIKHITYLILNKGKIVSAKRFEWEKGQSLVTLSLTVTKDMVPSFRIVAYYHVGTEVVSDSVWVDVKDTCLGKLEIKSEDPGNYQPAFPFSLTITGDPGAKVGLVAVDKGVYVLNSKNRLTQTKIWDVVEKQDVGCTAGSGANSMDVFYDAGLAFVFYHTGLEFESSPAATKPRSDPSCPNRPRRRGQRSLTLMDLKNSLASQAKYTDLERECCRDGMVDNLLGYTCKRRAQFINDGPECEKAFVYCCSEVARRIKDAKEGRTLELARICVSEPFEMKVMKQFFVDLKLPYAAVRNEQVEIKAVLHNYLDAEIKVRVELTETEGVCSAASKKGKYRTTDIYMDALSSRAVPFVIIPMELSTHTIEVKAAAVLFDLRDGVKKDLRVVPEGIQTKLQTVSVVLDPSAYGGEQHERIDAAKLNYLVPGSTPQTFVSVTGELLSETIQAVISGKPLGSLIHQPGGCGEQNMIAMTGPVIATHYLDRTNQWASVGLDRRAEAIKFISNGYTQQLKYRKPDGSYSIFENENTSTWLTAYVAKVFGMAYQLVPIEDDVLCSAIKWLVLNAQEPDGMFKEHGKVYQSEMMGGVPGKDVDVSLTAFILIAMQESRQCESQVRSLPGSIARSKEFLLKKVDSLKNPYAVALTSYALANEGKHMVDLLNRFSSDKTHWHIPENHYSTLEATGYALLALVKAKEFDQAGRVVKWLTEQRFYGGGYGSTQATIIVFQAISEYMIELPKREDVDLKVTLNVTGRGPLRKWTFTSDKTHLTRSDKYQFNKNLTVTATGAGRGTLSVVTVYNALPENRKEDCKNFELLVKLEKEPKVSYEGALETYKLTIEMLFLSTVRSATMSILDITMLTGFIADTNDLKKLTSGKDRYVQKIETDKQLSEKGSLILYLEEVSHELSDRVVFRIHMMNRVGLLQPAAVTVYEYNSLENRCVKFYHPEKEDGALNRICHEDVCRCAEENCSYQKKRQDEDLDRFLAACGPNMDYVYKVKVVHANLSASIDHFTLEAEEIIKPGTDLIAKGAQRTFLAHPYCRAAMDLREGMSYLIMGMFEDVIFGKDRLLYMLGGGTWIEYWPTEVECQQPKFYDTCVSIRKDSDELVYYGCPN